MSNVVNINAFKKKKQEVVNRTPEPNDFGDRISRIRSSLDRINVLMSELKKMSSKPTRDSDEEII